jgi:uncharacterized protein YgbK (DUF1537 family)
VISKGGTTTQTLLAEGLGLDWVALQGQLLPGLSLVVVPASVATGGPVPGAFSPRGPDPRVAGLPVVTFPGNLGDAETLDVAWRLMEGG